MIMHPAGFQYGRILKRQKVGPLHLIESLYPAGFRTPLHAHQHAIFCLTLGGNYTECYQARAGTRPPSTLVFNPPNAVHSTIFGSTETRLFRLEIDPRWLEAHGRVAAPPEAPSEFNSGLVVGLVVRLLREFREPDTVSPLAIEGLTLEMIAESARRLTAKQGRGQPRWLGQLVDLLHSHFADHLRLSQIAEVVGVHPVYLASEFRRRYQCTVGEYVRRRRIDYATQQLVRSSSGLAQIALEAGFASQSHFCRVFKRMTGMTPLPYRTAFSERGGQPAAR